MDNNLLGEQIAKYRKAAGLTQEELGKTVGISAQAVSRWECGGAPDIMLLPIIADRLGVSVDALFGRETGEQENVEDAVRRWMLKVPQGQRIDQLCRLVWTAAGPAMSGKPEDVMDISGYENCCETGDLEDGKAAHWLRRTRITMLCEGVYVILQFIMMQSFDAAINLDFQSFLLWTGAEVAGYGLYLGIATLEGIFEARAIRTMNNQVRHDLYLSLLDKTHTAYHSQDTGEYISWLTNNVKQMEHLAWAPFFSCVGNIALVVWCILALISLHWLMLAAGLVSAAVMLVVPKLFQKHMEQLGEACATAEADGVSKLKDLLSGFDVLRSFGRTDRFLQQGDSVSDQIERPNCRRSCVQSSISCLTGFFSVSLQILQQVVTVMLAFQGKIILGAMASASNLTAGIANGLRTIANHRMSLASAKPYGVS